MKRILIMQLIIGLSVSTMGQALSLDSCQLWARNNYPQLKQYGLIERASMYNIENANQAYLPQLHITGKATIQSEVTTLPLSLPGVTLPELSKYQYNIALELSQVIWDGGLTQAQKKNVKANAEAEKQKLEVDLYALRERIDQLFFSIMLINSRLEQNNILQDALTTSLKMVTAMQQQGMLAQSDVDAVLVEQLNAEQQKNDLISTRKSYIGMLSAFTGKKLKEEITPTKPLLAETPTHFAVKRPELQFFDAQKKHIETQKSMLAAQNLPKIGAFLQTGYGRPGLNMLTNAFSPYYMGGIRLSWNISGLYSQKIDVQKLEIAQRNIDLQKETFLFNNSLFSTQQVNEIDKLKHRLKTDAQIIKLKENIRKATESKLSNGTATTSDLLREINSENLAKQMQQLHAIQLYATYFQYLHTVRQ